MYVSNVIVPIISQSNLVLMLYLGILHRVIISWWLGIILLHRINLCVYHCVGTPLCNFRWRLVDEMNAVLMIRLILFLMLNDKLLSKVTHPCNYLATSFSTCHMEILQEMTLMLQRNTVLTRTYAPFDYKPPLAFC